MPDAITHPMPQELTAFGLGKLPEGAAAAIAAHLDSCPACRQAVAAVLPDSFLDKVRAASLGGSSFPPNPPQPVNALSSAGRPATPAAAPNLPPELANHPKYRILRELGRGGMGVVYQARQTGIMDRQVVIKVINRSLLDHPDALERFLREVQAAAQLSHANIVTAYDAEQAGELHMLVMEFVPGQSLAEVLEKKGPLPVANACHYMRQAALGLQHAHERGMVHRDIKPANLMLMPKGQVKILDFGLAKVASERSAGKGLTSSDAYMGTPDYSAPEQATDARKADIRADLYSLGCTLYCLLAGRPPFREDTAMKTILAHIEKQPQPLPELRPDVPERLCAVVARLLAKDPAQRYQKPVEVVQALAPFVKPGAKPSAGSSPAPSPGVGSPRRGARIDTEASQIKRVLRDVPGKAPPREVPAKDEPSPFADLVDAPARPGARARGSTNRGWYRGWLVLAGVSLLLLALVGMWASGVIRVKTKDGTIVLENLPPDADVTVDGGKVTATSGDGKTFEVRVDPGKKHRVEIKREGFKVFGDEVEVDVGGRKSVVVKLVPKPKEGEIEATKSPDDKGKAVPKPLEVAQRLPWPGRNNLATSFSEDGRLCLAFALGGDAFRVWEKETGKLVQEVDGLPPTLTVRFFPDGKQLLSSHYDGTFRRWDLNTGKVLDQIPTTLDGPQIQGFASDGDRFASWSNNLVQVWDLKTGKERFRVEPSREKSALLASAPLSPDGKRLLTVDHLGSEGVHVRIFDVATRKQLLSKSVKLGGGTQTWSADGHRIYLDAGDFALGTNVIACLDADTGELMSKVPLVPEPGSSFGRAVSRDTRYLAVQYPAANLIHLYDTRTGKLAGTARRPNAQFSFSFSPNGRYAACGGQGEVIIYRMPEF